MHQVDCIIFNQNQNVLNIENEKERDMHCIEKEWSRFGSAISSCNHLKSIVQFPNCDKIANESEAKSIKDIDIVSDFRGKMDKCNVFVESRMEKKITREKL